MFGTGGVVFAGLRFVFLDVAIVVDLLVHWTARVHIGARVDGFGREEQRCRDDADDGGKTPALLIRIVAAHERNREREEKRQRETKGRGGLVVAADV